MTTPPTRLDCLKRLAAVETVRLNDLGQEGLDDLLAQGLILRDDRPQQTSLEARYVALQEVHRQIVEAKGCADRLQRRMAPRSRLAGLLPLGTPAGPGPNDPDAIQLLELLDALKLQIREVKAPQDVPSHLERIQDYLQVEGREFGKGSGTSKRVTWYLVVADKGRAWISGEEVEIFASREQAIRVRDGGSVK